MVLIKIVETSARSLMNTFENLFEIGLTLLRNLINFFCQISGEK